MQVHLFGFVLYCCPLSSVTICSVVSITYGYPLINFMCINMTIYARKSTRSKSARRQACAAGHFLS
ncbi:uncharacterized protein SCHCODRAFT_02037792 [Schizophyllum commune H4-8]|uniref:uncharacterized protein n=1 Tax=Schizophyllum commune (strain H4-8 / FGSC 9210) TaxID=578458 RepID=UPI0021609B05|nr:uncharacterized protein SCHCODRAFT_02037792 [Schizophyllum commune H4-8]KAI5900477.1 hypothetical protein SCHCODRAFT_02037792 [Schizophyllum commune H4-8]